MIDFIKYNLTLYHNYIDQLDVKLNSFEKLECFEEADSNFEAQFIIVSRKGRKYSVQQQLQPDELSIFFSHKIYFFLR